MKQNGKKSAQPRCSNPYRLNIQSDVGEVVPYPARCGWCWGCEQLRENDLVGQAAAQSLSCTHVDFVTFTYDSKRGVEARVGAKIRMPEHIKGVIQRLRQRERRGIATYNRRETKAALKDGREPQLVDNSRSYIKYVAVHEFGSKATKRSHWHVLLFYESHWPIRHEILALADPKETMPHASRVWNPPEIVGPFTRRRPPTAEDGSVIDFRVRGRAGKDGKHKKANQEWDVWPYGQVNVERVTHDPNNLVDGKPSPKEPEELANGVKYLFKYMRKNVKTPKRAPGQKSYPSQWTPEQVHEFEESKANRHVSRTRARALGSEYAVAWAEQMSAKGAQIKDFCFRIKGHNMRRDFRSTVRYQHKLKNSGVSDSIAETVTERRKLFEMRGAMRETAYAAYADAWRRKRKKETLDLGLLGPLAYQCQMKRESEEFNEFLRSEKAAFLRFVEQKNKFSTLPETLPPVHVYARNKNGDLLDGEMVNGRRKEVKFRKPEDRLAERRRQIEGIRRRYEEVASDSRKYQRFKNEVSKEAVQGWLTEVQYAERPEFERERFRRKVDAEHIERVVQETRNAAFLSDEAFEEMQFLADYLTVKERDEFGRPRHDIWHDLVGNSVLWKWLNQSDDYNWRQRREEMTFQFCAVDHLTPEKRVIVNPHGEVFIQRLTFSKAAAAFECPNTGQTIRHAGFKRWATRKALTGRESEAAFAGELPNRSPMDQDCIFAGPEPLKNHLQREIPWAADDGLSTAYSWCHRYCGEYMDVQTIMQPWALHLRVSQQKRAGLNLPLAI